MFGKITPEKRRKNTIKMLKKEKIGFNPHLSLLESSEEVKLKSTEAIIKRALASMICIQMACSIGNGDDLDEAYSITKETMEKWGVTVSDLTEKERRIIENDGYTMQDAVDTAWNYEANWSLLWALGLISDKEMKNATKICNTDKAIATSCVLAKSSKVKPKSVEEILDMLDLFFCYHWACVDKRAVNPEMKIGNLNPEVVPERRKGLEWLISEEEDWDDISLDT